MTRILKKALFFIAFVSLQMPNSFCDNVQQSQDDVSVNSAKIIHIDPTPTIVKKIDISDRTRTLSKPIQLGVSYQNTGNVSLICYKSGICLVKDTRCIKAQFGINEIEFDNLYPGLIYESINFRTPKKGKIVILSYIFNKKDMSRYNIFSSSIGGEIYYVLKEDAKIEKGKLLDILKEKDESYAFINSDNKCFSIPLSKCVAVNEKVLQLLGNNSLKLLLDAPERDDIYLEISYLINSIHWNHVCLIDVFEKLDRVDVSSQAILRNDTNIDLDNVLVTFDTSSPNISVNNKQLKSSDLKMDNHESHSYKRNLTLKKNSEIMCVLKSTKSLKPILEHIVKIPLISIESSVSKEIDIPVKNLLTIENAKSLGIDVDFLDSEALIFQRVNNERTFLGKQTLSSIKSGDNFVFETGNTYDIIATVQQTDLRKISEKTVEYGVRVLLKNNKAVNASTLVAIDVDVSWNVTKKNFEMQKSEKPLWRLELEPNGTKELYFRIRIGK